MDQNRFTVFDGLSGEEDTLGDQETATEQTSYTSEMVTPVNAKDTGEYTRHSLPTNVTGNRVAPLFRKFSSTNH